MRNSPDQRFAVIGAGPVGCYNAIALSRNGYDVGVREQRPDPREVNNVEGRSVNLALSSRGHRALDELGILEDVQKIQVPMHGRVIRLLDRIDASHSYGSPLQSVHRGQLARLMVEIAEREGISILFDTAATDVTFERFPRVMFGADHMESPDFVIAADGANSIVRRAATAQSLIQSSTVDFPMGYKEFHIPPTEAGGYRLDHEYGFHIWPRGKFMMIALPNTDGSFTGTLFMPKNEMQDCEYSFDRFKNEEGDFVEFFYAQFPDLRGVINDPWEQYSANNGEPANLYHVDCSQWTDGRTFLLMGDAAHGVVPFYGQGLNIGLESSRKFHELLRTGDDIGAVSQRFNEARVDDVRAVSSASLYNYEEMAHLSADPMFQARRRLAALFASKYPGVLTDLHYDMTFTHKPQAEIWSKDRKFERILENAFESFPKAFEAVMSGILPRNVENHLKKKLV